MPLQTRHHTLHASYPKTGQSIELSKVIVLLDYDGLCTVLKRSTTHLIIRDQSDNGDSVSVECGGPTLKQVNLYRLPKELWA